MKELICIVCPKGCHLKIDDNNNVTGNSCKRGIEYAISETTNPTRTITSTVKIENGTINRLPIRTEKPIPKSKIFDVMDYLNTITVSAPIKVGDIIVENILDTNVNIIATRTINKKENI